MATGRGLRAKWTKKLATSIGWSRQRLAHLLAHNGMDAPYKSELKALQILAGYGISLKKYTPTEDAVGVEVVPATVKPFRGLEVAAPSTAKKKGMTPTKIGEGGDTSPPPEDEKKKHGSWSDRLLISRLAKLLPEGMTSSGKNRARYILKKQGITENPKVLSEATALEAFEKAGIDISGFEYASKPGEPGGLLVQPAAREYDSLLRQYTDMGARLKKAMEDLAERDSTLKTLQDKLNLVRSILLSFEKLMTGTPKTPGLAATKFGGWPKPLNYVIDALNEIRE